VVVGSNEQLVCTVWISDSETLNWSDAALNFEIALDLLLKF